MNWKNKQEFPPFLGFFYLSPLERLVHSIIILLLGAFVASYKYSYLYNSFITDAKPSEGISSWYVTPFVLISFWLIMRMIRPKFITKYYPTIEDRILHNSNFWKYFLIETIWDLAVLMVVHFSYIFFVVLFIMNIWN